MQPIRKLVSKNTRVFLHLCLLGVLLAVFLMVSSSGRPPATPSSYETSVSAFRVHERTAVPAMADPAVSRSVEAIFAGIPQHHALLGDPDAPVTMRFLGDPECPQARQFAIRLLPLLVRRWVRDGRVRIEYLVEQAETVWPRTYRIQQFAVLAAGGQRKLWQYLESFYRYQGPEYTRYADERFFRDLAEEVPGLDVSAWIRERRTADWLHLAAVHEMRVAQLRHIEYTPAFLIGPTGGPLKQLVDFTLTEPLAFEAAFEEAMGA